MNELEKCKQSMRYFAENYLEIQGKGGRCYSFSERQLQDIEQFDRIQKQELKVVGRIKGRNGQSLILKRNEV